MLVSSWRGTVAASVLAVVFALVAGACGGSDDEARSRERELDLRERELAVREAELAASASTVQTAAATASTTTVSTTTTTTVAPSPVPTTVAAPPPPYDPNAVAAGVIENGRHFGYVVNFPTPGTFSFDRADVVDGYWTNENPRLRELPTAGARLDYGMPVEVIVENQRVTAVYPTQPGPAPVAADETRVAAGVIEDGVHYGYLVDFAGRSFTFDRADVIPGEGWRNENQAVRELPWPDDRTGVRVYDAFTGAPVTGLYSGMALEVIVVNQHVVGVYRVNG
jgi:hypothetical protein